MFGVGGAGQQFEAIDDEIARQQKLKAEGKFTYTCLDHEMTDLERLAVLVEEVGEAGHEINETIGRTAAGDYREKLQKELVQIAAVTVAWLIELEYRERNGA